MCTPKNNPLCGSPWDKHCRKVICSRSKALLLDALLSAEVEWLHRGSLLVAPPRHVLFPREGSQQSYTFAWDPTLSEHEVYLCRSTTWLLPAALLLVGLLRHLSNPPFYQSSSSCAASRIDLLPCGCMRIRTVCTYTRDITFTCTVCTARGVAYNYRPA